MLYLLTTNSTPVAKMIYGGEVVMPIQKKLLPFLKISPKDGIQSKFTGEKNAAMEPKVLDLESPKPVTTTYLPKLTS